MGSNTVFFPLKDVMLTTKYTSVLSSPSFTMQQVQHGTVVSEHQLASDIGVTVLAAGKHRRYALIATAFAVNPLCPYNSEDKQRLDIWIDMRYTSQ